MLKRTRNRASYGALSNGRMKKKSDANTGDGLPVPERYWAIFTIVLGLIMAVMDGAIAQTAAQESHFWSVSHFLVRRLALLSLQRKMG